MGCSNLSHFGQAVMCLQFNLVRVLIIQLVGLDEIKFDTEKFN